MGETQKPAGRIINDQAAESITRAEELSYEIRIDQVMVRDPFIVEPGMRMRDALEIFRSKRISGAPVAESTGNLVGVISMEDLIVCLLASDLDSPVSKYMTSPVITVKCGDPVVDALKLFVSRGIGRLPVINPDGKMVGVLTKGDITRGLLKALQHEYQAEEVRRYRASHLFEDIESDRSSLILRYNIKAHDFTHGGAASSNIKRALLRLGANPQIARRCGIAVYEAEMNLIIHTISGGIIRVEIEPHQISIDVYDDGPGIANVELAMKPGYSTATDQIREMGFGAGMGLANISRCVDSIKLESVIGKGTRLRVKIYLSGQAMGEGYPQSQKGEPS